MDREWAHTDKLVEILQKLSPGARATYFPVAAKYLVFCQVPCPLWPGETIPKELTGNMYDCKQAALLEAIEFLQTNATLEKKRVE